MKSPVIDECPGGSHTPPPGRSCFAIVGRIGKPPHTFSSGPGMVRLSPERFERYPGGPDWLYPLPAGLHSGFTPYTVGTVSTDKVE